MSRSGYTEDWWRKWDIIRWRGAVKSALRGARGQTFLKELDAALEALPVKRLIANELEIDGEVCAIGAVGRARGIEMSKFDMEDCYVSNEIANAFNIANAMTCEIMYVNDEFYYSSPEERYEEVRRWVKENLR